MKTKIARFVAALFLIAAIASHAHAQSFNAEDVAGCLVSDVTGKVTYTEKGNSTPKPVTAGTVLPEDATVSVSKKSNFTLICDDRSLLVDKKGVHQAAMLSKDVQAKGEVSRFAKMAFAAKGYGDAPPDTTKRKKGGFLKDSILFKYPIQGKLPAKFLTFSWGGLKHGTIYRLIIYQNSKETPIFLATSTSTSLGFDVSQLAIQSGQSYYTQVILANDPNTSSNVVPITFVAVDEEEKALSALKQSKEYLKGSTMQKILMEAMELEYIGLNSLAYERYQSAMKLGTNSSMANQMFSAFWERVHK